MRVSEGRIFVVTAAVAFEAITALAIARRPRFPRWLRFEGGRV